MNDKINEPNILNMTTVKKLNLDYVNKSSKILIIGKRGSCKTVLTKDILSHYDDIPKIILTCNYNNYLDIPNSIVKDVFHTDHNNTNK